ncbi:MAG: hypothetical protein ABR612_05045 [Chromatocurvus sp.]
MYGEISGTHLSGRARNFITGDQVTVSGRLIVNFWTSPSELVVSIDGALSERPDIVAIGNLVGGDIFLLGYAASLCLNFSTFSRKATARQRLLSLYAPERGVNLSSETDTSVVRPGGQL